MVAYSIFFRHLYGERNDEFLINLERFVKAVVGNSYKLSFKNLLFQRQSMNQSIEKRPFFCSELVAKAFKELGLLKTERACCQFMP